MNQFAKRLKELRESRNLSQNELGKLLGLSKMGISHYETGNSEPGLDTLLKIAQIFNVSVDYLLGAENE